KTESAVNRTRRRAMSKSAFVLILLWAVPIGTVVGVGVSEAVQCHDIHSDFDRGGISALGAWGGTIAGGPLKGPYAGQFVGTAVVAPDGYAYGAALTIPTDRGTLEALVGAGVTQAGFTIPYFFFPIPFAEVYTVTGGDGRFLGAFGNLFM